MHWNIKNKTFKKRRDKQRGAQVGLLTLDVDGDAGLFAVGDCLVGGLADDLLPCLDVGWWKVKSADGAFSPAVPQQRLDEIKSNNVNVKVRRNLLC